MADSEGGQSKKRVAGRQISKENPELDDDGPEPEMGTFKKASDEVLAARRIVKVKRAQPTTQSSASNPFATLKLVPPPEPTNNNPDLKNDTLIDDKQENKAVEEKSEEKTEGKAEEPITVSESKVECDEREAKAEKEIENEETVKEEKNETEGEAANEPKETEKEEANETQATSFTSFKQLSSSQNAFMGFAGTGFGSSSHSFGSISADKPLFNMSSSNNGNTPTMQEKPTETGEENERAVFTADAILYEYMDANWKERGKGELKLNVSLSDDEKGRLVMRTKGNYRLVLNASLYPDMNLTGMEKKGVTFACVNSAGEGKTGLTTFAIKFRDASFVQEFRGAVEAHKGKKNEGLKTPENSPKASDA